MYVKVIDDSMEFYYSAASFLTAISTSSMQVSLAEFIKKDGVLIKDIGGARRIPPTCDLVISLRDVRSVRQTIMEYGEDRLEEIIQMYAL